VASQLLRTVFLSLAGDRFESPRVQVRLGGASASRNTVNELVSEESRCPLVPNATRSRHYPDQGVARNPN
jgi:hypothetical protein